MRKRNLAVFILVICVLVMFVTGGCAKKPVKKAEVGKPVITEEKAVAEEQQAPIEDQTAKERAVREQALKERALKELAAKELAALVDIHFDFDKFNLKPEARDILEQHADWLLEHKDYNLVIEGHCDERGTTEYNLALGERRASATQKYLTDLGVDETRLKTISYGEERPLDPRHNEEAWAKNRRAHFVLKKSAP